jgi:hypothetical protein
MVEEVYLHAECGPKAKRGKNYKQGYWTGDIQLHNIQTVLQAFSQRWDRQPFVSSSTSGAVTWPNLKSKWAFKKTFWDVENYQLHALEQPITTQQYSNSPLLGLLCS